MFEEFEALNALKKHGTLAIAGAYLHVEASTVWKRIQSLERAYGHKLLEKKGRNAYLTPQAETLLQLTEAPLDSLKEILRGYQASESLTNRPLRVGLSESIAISWGPRILKNLIHKIPQTSFELSTQRGSLLIEKLRHGDFDFIICAGSSHDNSTLMGEKLFDEEMLFYKIPENEKIYCIEESALSFEWVKEETNNLFNSLRKKHEIFYLQSYGPIASLIVNEIAGGIIPLGVSKRFKVPERFLSKLPRKLNRPIYLYTKKSFYTSQLGNKIFALK
jgi:molybdenum-dependent DNA-binding transcriptional regulator ModE